jgi:hypothetical protein
MPKELSSLLEQLVSDLCPVDALRLLMDSGGAENIRGGLSKLVSASLHLRAMKAESPKRWLLTETDTGGITFMLQNSLDYGEKFNKLWDSILK